MSKKSTQKELEDKIWKYCRTLVYNRDNVYGQIDCFTCPAKNIEGRNRQLGHVPWPKSVLSAFLKYDLRCLKYQCYACNINRGGMGAEAYKRLLKENGKSWMKQLEKDKQKSVKATDHYAKLITEYELILGE
jgi:hypothetical protein